MNFIRNPHFPWRLLRTILLRSFVLLTIVIAVVFVTIRYVFLRDLEAYFPTVEWNNFLNGLLLLILASALVLFAGIVAFVFVELLVPLGMLYAKVKAIDKLDNELEEDELAYEEPGEWSDLESAISHIREELVRSKKKSYRNRMTMYSLLSALPEGIVAVDLEQQPIFYNQSFLDAFKVGPDDLEKLKIIEVMREPSLLEAFARCLEKHEVQKVDFKIEEANDFKIFQVSISPLRDTSESKVYGAVSIFQDVTELKRLEQIRIDFVANVSHELRTPLTSVKGYAQALSQDLREKKFDQGEKYLEVVSRNVDRLLVLVNDLLDLSSLESGIRLSLEKLDTASITESVLEQLEPIRIQKKIDLKLNYHAPNFWGDAMRAQQVLMNLVQNAFQYVPQGGSLEVTWLPAEAGVELHVKDNGPGIGREHLRRIFERFYRIDKARARENGGTGLGLAIVKHIMQRHGGYIKAESQLGKGTEFVCFFPTR